MFSFNWFDVDWNVIRALYGYALHPNQFMACRHMRILYFWVAQSITCFTEDQLAEYKQTVESLKQQTEQAKVRCCGYVPSYNHILHKKFRCSIIFVCISSALSNDFVPVREFSFVGFFHYLLWKQACGTNSFHSPSL